MRHEPTCVACAPPGNKGCKFLLQGLKRFVGGSDAIVVENCCISGLVTPLMYGKTAKPFWESGGSLHLKNIPINSSGEGMTA